VPNSVSQAEPEWRIKPEAWEAALAATDGTQIIVGGPGTGKTEFLVRRARHLLDQGVGPEQLYLLSFSRRSAADLKLRLETSWERSAPVVSASTFHSLAIRLLETYAPEAFSWNDLPGLLTGPEQVSLVARLLGAEDPADWSAARRPVLGTRTFAGEATDFILRCQEMLLDAAAVEQAGRAEWKGLPQFLIKYQAELQRLHRIDYGTLIARAVELVSRPDVSAKLTAGTRYVLVDEFQDITPAQTRLLDILTRHHRNLAVAADPYQSIYSFRGADLNRVARFPDEFRDRAGQPARRLVLTTSFRVPAQILEAAVRIAAGAVLPGAAGPVEPVRRTGSVETYVFRQATEEAEWIASEIHRLHFEQRIPYRDLAVFVRSKRRLLADLSRALERRRIPHDQPDARLADQPAVRMVIDCVIAATQPQEASRAVSRILLGPLFRLNPSAWRNLERERIRSGLNWPTLLGRQPEYAPLAGLISQTDWATRRSAADGFWELWTGLPQFAELVRDPDRRPERAAWSSFSQVLRRLLERDPTMTLADYVRLLEEEDFEATPLLSFHQPSDDRVTLTTLHQSKGLEFEVIFIGDAVERVFPDLRSRDSLLGTHHLVSDRNQEADYLHFRLQEESRLCYTAMVRARRRVVMTATDRSASERQGPPSRFLAMAAGTATVEEAARLPASPTLPITPLEAEAWLRRIAADLAEDAPRRRAAITLLAQGPTWNLRSPSAFRGLFARGPDRGVPIPATLSPTQADTYETCPRRYVLTRRLGIDSDLPGTARFGSLIHRVLEAVEREANQAGVEHADPAAALAEFERTFDPREFDGEPYASSWRQRGRVLLTALYGNWPGRGRGVLFEHPLALEIDGTHWKGRADRIDIEDSGLRIVDYKTSKDVKSIEEAATSLQLGYYVLASKEDSDVQQLGSEVTGASMWFIGGDKLSKRNFDTKHLEDVHDRLAAVAAGITSEVWEPTPNEQCDRCSVRALCPAWTEEAFL